MENMEKKLLELEAKIDKIYESVEKTRKYFLWTTIITLILIIVPIIGLFFVIPNFLSSYSNLLNI